MKKNIIADYMAQNHIYVLTPDEIANGCLIGVLYCDSEELWDLASLIDQFADVRGIFDNSDELMAKLESKNENDEAAIFELRHKIEQMFYNLRDVKKGERNVFTAVCIKHLISIIICMPTLVLDNFQKDVLNFAQQNNLL